ncbi:aminotransferase class III-fold pyridoxal phosphate-dependent enzyme, partial [Methylococcus sp. S1B]|uniref:aminotransferase class III-fold pyridoxal phosphate-dependent enzyme n=1 Tax=Methylococcus sp. S1B TaxID=3435347 RepID=UPI003D7DD927
LSGGFSPVGAVAMKKHIREAVFNRMDRAVVHGSTFSKNNMARAAGIATLDAIEEDGLVENAARIGEQITAGIRARA